MTGNKPFPRRPLGTGTIVLLWFMRVYVIIAVPLVVYAFFRALHAP